MKAASGTTTPPLVSGCKASLALRRTPRPDYYLSRQRPVVLSWIGKLTDLYARPSQIQSVTLTSDASHRSDRLTGFSGEFPVT